jgi:hypothetical protein
MDSTSHLILNRSFSNVRLHGAEHIEAGIHLPIVAASSLFDLYRDIPGDLVSFITLNIRSGSSRRSVHPYLADCSSQLGVDFSGLEIA